MPIILSSRNLIGSEAQEKPQVIDKRVLEFGVYKQKL